MIIVHYTATYEDQDVSKADVDKWHRAQGYNGFGYHGLIRLDGTFEAGRPLDVRGAHCRDGFNNFALGICYAGGLKRATGPNVGHDTRTAEQTARLIEVINEWRDRTKTIREVVGHRDCVKTQCPGFDVKSWWGGVLTGEPKLPLMSDPSARAVTNALVVKGHRGDVVRRLQTLLHTQGVAPGKMDGLFGPKTEQAVKDFQKLRKLTADGKVGPATWYALFH